MSRVHRVTPIFTTVQRSSDWQAHVTGDTKRWEAGRTEAEAIGKLLITLEGPSSLVGVGLDTELATTNYREG